MKVCVAVAALVLLTGCGNHFCIDCTESGKALPLTEATVVHFRAFDPASGQNHRAGCFALRVGPGGFTEDRPVLLPIAAGTPFAVDWFEDARGAGSIGIPEAALCTGPFSPEIDWSELRPDCLEANAGVLSSVTFVDPSGNEGTPPAARAAGGVRYMATAEDAGSFGLTYGTGPCRETREWGSLTLFRLEDP